MKSNRVHNRGTLDVTNLLKFDDLDEIASTSTLDTIPTQLYYKLK
jgi:hypothetical protein